MYCGPPPTRGVPMNEKPTPAQYSRRQVLVEGSSAAFATAAMASLASAQQSQSPASDTRSQNISDTPPTNPAPTNEDITKLNPDSWTPPHTDAGDVSTFKYPFSFGHNRVSKCGWASQRSEEHTSELQSR